MTTIRSWIRRRVADVVGDDEKRFQLQMVWVFRIVAVIAAVMTVLNMLVREHQANPPIIGFGAVCLLSSWLIIWRPKWRLGLLSVLLVAITALFAFFIISGQPQGFSPIWICIVPPLALLLMGRWQGGLWCLTLLVLQISLMWTPWGKALLQYDYKPSFLTRLPLVYIAAFAVSWFLEYVREVTQKKLMETQRTLEHLYRHDALTGVMNRYGFNEHIAEVTREAPAEGITLMIIDLDDFKRINDRYGHLAGDTTLQEIARTIGRVMNDGGKISRWGGEEFAVIMYRAEGAQEMAEAIRLAIAAMRVEFDGDSVGITVSIGVTVCTGKEIDAERLVTMTDKSLYRAKTNGKNQVVLCDYSPAEE